MTSIDTYCTDPRTGASDENNLVLETSDIEDGCHFSFDKINREMTDRVSLRNLLCFGAYIITVEYSPIPKMAEVVQTPPL